MSGAIHMITSREETKREQPKLRTGSIGTHESNPRVQVDSKTNVRIKWFAARIAKFNIVKSENGWWKVPWIGKLKKAREEGLE
jgi:hypothetical protein